MNSLWKDVAAAILMGMVMPGLVVNGMVMLLNSKAEPTSVAQTAAVSGTETLPLPGEQQNREGSQDMEAYLVGVVLAEMPSDFEPEALKAQAVAARTYTRKAGLTGGKHGDGSVCTDAACCQAWISPEEYLTRGGTEEGLERVRTAVYATAGEVLTYEGELIEATYFSCSGGRTEDAVAVWGADFPYLQSVSSPGEEAAAHYRDTVIFTPVKFQKLLGVTLQGQPDTWFGEVKHTDGGGVAEMVIGGKCYTGTQLRSVLGLRSTAFAVTAGESDIVITTRGYGHRVGMSQYGADAMAVAGSSYEEILAHYYPGTVLTTVTD